MRRVIKDPESRVLKENLTYISGNTYNNGKIANILFDEQKKFCAYTDEYISRTDAKDIEHFDPTLKDKPEDNYNNWFLVKHQWNKEKSYKWSEYQPILSPTAVDFEERVIYNSGDYIANKADLEASNLIKLLKLDDRALAEKRKKYITRKKKEIEISGNDALTYFSDLMTDDVCQVHYLRAIKEEFNVDIWQMIS